MSKISDPLLYGHSLPVTTFYPFGHALELATDSSEVTTAAAAIWSRYPKLFDASPVRFRIAVAQGNAEIRPRPSMPRGQEHLVSIVHGSENFAVADLAQGFGFACLTRDVAGDHAYAAYHFLEPIAYLLLVARRLTILHAACVALDGRAVLLAGHSGSGKTCLSYACARRGWTFLSGDACQFVRGGSDGMVIGRPFSIRFREGAQELFPELSRYPAGHRLNGKVDIDPPIDDLNIAIALQAPAANIVFLDRSTTAVRAAARPVTAAEAFSRLEDVFFFGDDRLRAEQRIALTRFIEPCPAFELTYSDLDEAELVLRDLMQCR